MSSEEGTKMITIRAPVWLHKACKRAAHDKETSMNEFLLNVLENGVREHQRKTELSSVAQLATTRSA